MNGYDRMDGIVCIGSGTKLGPVRKVQLGYRGKAQGRKKMGNPTGRDGYIDMH